VYAAFCRADISPEIIDVSNSTEDKSISGYAASDPWPTSASSDDLPSNFPPLTRPDGGRARPATFAVNGRNCVIDDWMFRVCRRRSAERDALPVSQVERITHLDGPVICRSAPRPADGGTSICDTGGG
jgi:hypothetical protein